MDDFNYYGYGQGQSGLVSVGSQQSSIDKKQDAKIQEISDIVTGFVEVTYSELKELRNSGKLVPGQRYRITDYETVVWDYLADTISVGGHVFDIIVRATNESALSEYADAIRHEGDTYFSGSNLSLWSLRYCLDNDVDRFNWANSENGKGVIYYMRDEWNNECPYDFKNIIFHFSTYKRSFDTSIATFFCEHSGYTFNNVGENGYGPFPNVLRVTGYHGYYGFSYEDGELIPGEKADLYVSDNHISGMTLNGNSYEINYDFTELPFSGGCYFTVPCVNNNYPEEYTFRLIPSSATTLLYGCDEYGDGGSEISVSEDGIILTGNSNSVNIVFNGDVKSGKIVVEFSGISDGSLGDRFTNNTIRPKYTKNGRRMLLPRVIIIGDGHNCTLNLGGGVLPIVLDSVFDCNVDLYQDEEYYDATMGFIPNTNAFFEGDYGYYGDAFVLYLNDVSSYEYHLDDYVESEIFDYFYKNIPVNLYGVWSKMALHIDFELTSEITADVSIHSSDYNTFEMQTSIEIVTDPESGEVAIVVGECPMGYGYFWLKKHHDLCGWFRDLLENCDPEAIMRLMVDPQVTLDSERSLRSKRGFGRRKETDME